MFIGQQKQKHTHTQTQMGFKEDILLEWGCRQLELEGVKLLLQYVQGRIYLVPSCHAQAVGNRI